MTSEDDVKNAFETAKSQFGFVNSAVSCAGIGIAVLTYNPNKDTMHSLKHFEKVLQVRARGVRKP